MEAKWWQKAAIYQIYLRSFQDSDGDGIGDIRGVIERLDYLKDLGIDTLCLSPIYANKGIESDYNIVDYYRVDSKLGTISDFDELIRRGHDNGLKIILDIPLNRTSIENKWFIDSRKSKKNPYHDFYIWQNEPNNWGIFGKSAWSYNRKVRQYFLHLFDDTQADLNWKNENLRKEIAEILNWWLAKGVDGFRLIDINLIDKGSLKDANQVFRSDYGNAINEISKNSDVTRYLSDLRRQIVSDKEVLLIGKTVNASINQLGKLGNLSKNQLNIVYGDEYLNIYDKNDEVLKTFSVKSPSLNELRSILSNIQERLSNISWNMLTWGDYKNSRSISYFGNDSLKYRDLSAKMLATLMYMLQGTLYIYQGEELGMTNARFKEIGLYRDKESLLHYANFSDKEEGLKYLKIKAPDNAKTPFPWNHTANSGFTVGIPWIEVNSNFNNVNVEEALADKDSIYYYYQKLIKIRKQFSVLTFGDYRLYPRNQYNDSVFAYFRNDGKNEMLIITNFSNQDIIYDYNIPADADLLISNYEDDFGQHLRPYEAKVYFYSRN